MLYCCFPKVQIASLYMAIDCTSRVARGTCWTYCVSSVHYLHSILCLQYSLFAQHAVPVVFTIGTVWKLYKLHTRSL